MRATKQQEEVSVESETEMYFILSKSMIISYTKYLMKFRNQIFDNLTLC